MNATRSIERATAILVVAFLFFVPTTGWSQTTGTALNEEARAERPRVVKLFERGAYRDALEEARRTDDAWALSVRSRTALLRNEVDRALELAVLANNRALDDAQRHFAVVSLARALVANGDHSRAEEALRTALKASPKAHAVRLELGKLLIATGRRTEGEVLLNALASFYNNGLVKTSDGLAVVSEAMAELGSFDDANYALQEAIQKDSNNVDALMQWGELLLGKYNTADAQATFSEVLGHTPGHPLASLGMARVELQLSNDYQKVREYLDVARAVFPNNKELRLTMAEVAIFDTDCEAARGHADTILESRPKDLEAMTIIAACHYLDDDVKAYERARDAVLKVNPEYARVLTETARYSERVHRYEEVVELNRQALEIVRDFAPALLGMGIGLSRVGREDEAAQYLARAFGADPYNVRAYNMVELYDKTMPSYRFTDHEGFQIRAHQSEEEAVNVVIPPLVSEALELYTDKYGFELDPYLAVEVFPNPKTFSVRSVGLPNITPHGICFGKVVVSRSPSDGNFNWAQVMWHELAHVYHLQMSDSRVPRWFTEGLAEYETNVKDPSWVRHHDRELSRALLADELRGVLELSEGFTHARSYEEILRSYHQSSLVIHFIVETWGFDVVPGMLEAWANRLDTNEVLVSVLKVSPGDFDSKFKNWLSQRYMNFRPQFTVNLARIPTATELERRVHADPDDARSWAELGVARLRLGNADGAMRAMERARQVDANDPWVNVVSALFAFDSGKLRDAYAYGRIALDAGADSYDIRVAMGQAAIALGDLEAAQIHLNSATLLWEGGVEAWRGLGQIARARDDSELARKALMKQFALDQHDPVVARQIFELGQERADASLALQGAGRWVDISPFDMRAQRAMTTAGAGAGNRALVDRAVETWLVLRPASKRDVLLEAVAIMSRAGMKENARKWAQKARAEGVSDQKVDAALSGTFDSRI